MKKTYLFLIVFLLIALPAVAQEQHGKIEGKVMTTDGKAIAGAQVNVNSKSLIRGLSAETDARGRFRFQLLPVGAYDIRVSHAQYQTFEQKGILVRIGALVSIRPVLQLGEFAEVITITGEAPVIDVKKTDAGETLTQEIISKLPTPRFPTDMIALAAGNVAGDDGSTMGGAGRTNSYKLDGIDVSDPATGTVWVFVNQESIEQMEVLPISGATADVGNFTGAALNMVTKSGGNEFSGGIAYYYFNDDFITWNTDDEITRDRIVRESKNDDFTVYAGGPILKDTAWFFGNVGLRKRERLLREDVLTYEYRNTMWKASTILSDNMNLWGTWHYDNYLREGRDFAYNKAPEATFDQEGPNKSFALNYAWVVDEDNLFEAKFHGWDGYFALTGNGSGPQLEDVTNNWIYGNADGDYRTDRNRYALTADFTHYHENLAGDHEFKFGAEWQRGQHETISEWDVIEIVNDVYDYRYGYDPAYYARNRQITYTFYITDSWTVSDRLLVNAGVRYDRPTYTIPDQELPSGETLTGVGDIHSFDNIAPRLGFTYKLTEDGKTLLRGSYGRYYEGMFTYMFDVFTPSESFYKEWIWDGSAWEEVYSESLGSSDFYTLDPDTSGLYADAFTVGLEKEMFRNFSVSADYIHREYKNYPVQIEDGRTWQPVTVTFEGNSYNVFSREGGPTHYTITNGDNDELFSKYDALIMRATKRYSDKWQLQASVTLSHLRGTAEDTDGYSGGTINSSLEYYQDPNNQINTEGLLWNHRPWNFKLNATYTLPYDINLSTVTSYVAGRRWAPLVRIYDDQLAQSRVTFLAEERGSRALDAVLGIDIRVEKEFRFDRFRASAFFDAYNLFNDDTVNDVENRLDYSDFGSATDLVDPRRYQIGVRFGF